MTAAARRRSAAGARVSRTAASSASASASGSAAPSPVAIRGPRRLRSAASGVTAGRPALRRTLRRRAAIRRRLRRPVERPDELRQPARAARARPTAVARRPSPARSSSERAISARAVTASGASAQIRATPGPPAGQASEPGGRRRIGDAGLGEDRLDLADRHRAEPHPDAARPDRRQQPVLAGRRTGRSSRRPAAPRAS